MATMAPGVPMTVIPQVGLADPQRPIWNLGTPSGSPGESRGNGAFHGHGGYPKLAGGFLLGKIPSFEMDDVGVPL